MKNEFGFPIFRATIEGLTPLSFSKKDSIAAAAARTSVKGSEAKDIYDRDHALDRLTIDAATKTVAIQSFALKMAISNAATRLNEPFKGTVKWGGKFISGLTVEGATIPLTQADGSLIEPKLEDYETGHGIYLHAINAHANGKRGSGSRVTRYMPHAHPGWRATFEGMLLDPDLDTKPGHVMLARAIKAAGMIVGIGQFRPENFGSNGRFRIVSLEV